MRDALRLVCVSGGRATTISLSRMRSNNARNNEQRRPRLRGLISFFPGRTTTDFDGVTFCHAATVLSVPRARFRFRSRRGWVARRSRKQERLSPVITVTYPSLKGRRKVFHGDNNCLRVIINLGGCPLTAIIIRTSFYIVWYVGIVLVLDVSTILISSRRNTIHAGYSTQQLAM